VHGPIRGHASVNFKQGWQNAIAASSIMAVLAFAWAGSAAAQDRAEIIASPQDGFGRIVLQFPDRTDFPAYSMRAENGVVAITFEQPISLNVPAVEVALPDYVSVARLDGDGRALRFGLRSALTVNPLPAGERLFIDLLPQSWQGERPGLPQDVVDELAERARLAAIEAERLRKAQGAEELDPQVAVRLGRNPTFLRLQFDWTVPTDANFVQEDTLGALAFEWPVPIDLTQLLVDLPPEIVSADAETTPDGSIITFEFADNVVPRFYETGPQQTILDFDLGGVTLPVLTPADLSTQAAAQVLPTEAVAEAVPVPVQEGPITPFVTTLGDTVRIVFPFEQEVPSAVFRRGNSVWMVFDTGSGINALERMEDLEGIASAFEATPIGDSQIVRIDLSRERMATLGSEGRAWVLSLGDTLLAPTEPLPLVRQRDSSGHFELSADLVRPARVHSFADPLVGDTLTVVTAYPPARGTTRQLDYVDFTALRTIHGLVIKPKQPEVSVDIEERHALISSPQGLTLSDDPVRAALITTAPEQRTGHIDFASLTAADAGRYVQRVDEMIASAAAAEGSERDRARLELAQFQLANGFAFESLGLLAVIEAELRTPQLQEQLQAARGIANVLAHRDADAISILSSPALASDLDATFWRAIARSDAEQYSGARQDVLAAEAVLADYPAWAQARFLLAGVRAAVETQDRAMASRLLNRLEFRTLSPEDASLYLLLSGRIEELEGRTQDAIDTYGQVIAMEVRPTRAEAIFRTLAILDAEGRLDLARAADTLSAEAVMWRGGSLESRMLDMLTDLYFREGEYRMGFETVREASVNQEPNDAQRALADKAQAVFSDLFLNGRADELGPVEALGLYYDFRQLTPPGSRGDEMIRNLARRLVSVDLLPQAAELLQYQIESRLTGAARAQVGADLALIYLADRQPDMALRVLNDTRLTNLSDPLTRQRRVLEARALIDAGRTTLALDMLSTLSGRDVDLLRVDANWSAGRYAMASELIEGMYPTAQLAATQQDRMTIVRAAVGYVLAGDVSGRARLRDRYADMLSTTPEWPLFDLVTTTLEPTGREISEIARQVTGADAINAFLSAYRASYESTGALVPPGAGSGPAEVAQAPPTGG
jgi:hypothetical protein